MDKTDEEDVKRATLSKEEDFRASRSAWVMNFPITPVPPNMRMFVVSVPIVLSFPSSHVQDAIVQQRLSRVGGDVLGC